MAKLPFRPVIGTDAQIQRSDPSEGYVWFATDSKKIYYSDGNAFLSMGGNSNIFYGVMELEDTPDEGQTEFIFTVFDIDGNDEVTDGNYAIPNIDDLILNKDGCFYRVTEVEESGEDAIIYTTKLTLAGGGGGGSSDGGGDSNYGKVTFDRITPATTTCLYKGDFILEFLATAKDASGELTGSGSYTVTINGKANTVTGTVKNGVKTEINVGPYLSLGENSVRVYITMDAGGSSLTTQSKLWTITTTQVELTWDYDETTLNSTNSVFDLDWEVSGIGIEKTTHIVIDDNWIVPPITQKSTEFHLSIVDLLAYNLTHGAHKIEMWATFSVDGVNTIPTPHVIKNAIFYTTGNDVPIISCGFFDNTVIQYNTVEIPIIFYQYGNNGTLTATLKENGNVVDTWTEIKNGEIKTWYYTPIESTTRNLVIQCGTTEKTLILEVEALEIDNKEIEGYAFRFKASDFASNTAVQNWISHDGNKAIFSSNFDWINGGIKSEKDENGNVRQYFRIKAGSTMTIDYPMFSSNAPATGKAFKFIFRADSCRDYDAQVLSCYDESRKIGLKMQAQQTLIKGSENQVIVPYCEDSYIEFEFDITKTDAVKRYLIPWMDGVPTALVQYGDTESFHNTQNIVIGSPDCDVCIYMIKLYEKHLTDNQHLQNFIADAPNAQEMLDRFNRNDIIDPERNVISPSLLAKKNPDCRVHVYEIDRMTLKKDDKIKGCTYTQYHGSDNPILFADDVEIRVQGTSSASYGLAAFNIDSKFTKGFTYADGSTSEGWSMNPGSIPVNYFCTKVNVASCEQANNALNQEWYNKFQPYKTKLRQKNPNARDCMEFTPGVLFMKDHNDQADFNNSGKFISNNLFAEIPGYISDPYERMYSICNMGNSKKNVEVLHDTSNPIEYCIEVADNQKPMQWMTDCSYSDSEWDAKEYFEFRYPDGHGELENTSTQFISPLTGEHVSHRQHAFDAWRRFITWMAHNNPQPKYNKLTLNSAEEFEEASVKRIEKDDGTVEIIPIDLFVAPQDANGNLTGVHTLVTEYDENNKIYYSLTDSPYGYTMEPLGEPKTYNNYEFKNTEYSSHLIGCVVTQYAGTYEYDTYEYRMAKMLDECEDYLVMDSVLFHYLFIERHTMIDNVSKNTFWSTEDGFHWNLTKNYDNDTADGNDNQGKLTLTYGIEPFDNKPGSTTDFYFNANQSVWFRFSGGLYEPCKALHKALESTGVNGKESAWDSKAYLTAFKKWQKTIPERCWIEDYYRKYIRPLEVYGDRMFVDMLEGGQKVHQRAQYETYQDSYISSKYAGNAATTNRIIIRGNGNRYQSGIPVSVYADCYIQVAFGSGETPNVSMRVKRNQPITIRVPNNLGTLDNATIYFFLPELYQTIGELGKGDLNILEPEQITVSPAVKLRTLVAGQYNENGFKNDSLEEIGFTNNVMLEDLYMANYPGANLTLDLKNAVNLKTLDLRDSGFTSVAIADGAPVNSIQLCNPGTISLANLRNLTTLTFQHPEEVGKVIINNIDNNTVNSKTDIVDICSTLNSYTLKNVKWKITDSNEIVNDKITVLERILNDMEPFTPQNQVDLETSESSLTGTLIIDSAAYNGTNSLGIYNYYASEVIKTDTNAQGEVLREYRRFPNLDIQFKGDQAKLYNITILKDDTNVLWKRKLRPGDMVDETFLSAGPNGAFDINDIYKSSTEYFDYVFTGKWNIFDSDTNEYVGVVHNSDKLPARGNVQQNLTFIPEFEASTRKWTVTFKQDNDTLATIPDIPAGTLLKDVIDTYYPDIPWKDDSLLDTYLTYSFEGYALSKTATSGLKVENYPVTSDMELYAIFKQMSVYENVHDDYWLYELTSSNAYTILKDDNPNYHIEKGYIVTPNPKKNLRGKITIPATYNDLPVYQISSSSFENNISVTHVFLGTGSKLRVIGSRAFMNSRIKFFEFTDELRRIEERAFMQASLLEPDATSSYIFGNNLYYMGGYAFNQALNFKGSAVTFVIPATLKTMGYYALSNFSHPAVNSSMTIGRPGEGSILDLSTIPGGSSSTDYRRISDATTSLFPSIQFYSKIYYNVDEEVTLANFQSKWTVGQMLGNDSGGIGIVEVIHTT